MTWQAKHQLTCGKPGLEKATLQPIAFHDECCKTCLGQQFRQHASTSNSKNTNCNFQEEHHCLGGISEALGNKITKASVLTESMEDLIYSCSFCKFTTCDKCLKMHHIMCHLKIATPATRLDMLLLSAPLRRLSATTSVLGMAPPIEDEEDEAELHLFVMTSGERFLLLWLCGTLYGQLQQVPAHHEPTT